MAALSEKILWPIVGIFIFGVLAGFYIDDRRRLMEEGASPNKQQASNEHAGKAAETKQASNEHTGKVAEKTPSSATTKQTASSSSSIQASGATSMDIDEYLAQSSNERSSELEANVTHHQGFSGSIEEYLSGTKPKATKSMQAQSNSNSTQQAAGASSMSIEEYQAKTSNQSQKQNSNTGAYHGGIDEYLAKYGDGTQTNLKTKKDKPFNKKEHMGFHGSYEEYAKKYN